MAKLMTKRLKEPNDMHFMREAVEQARLSADRQHGDPKCPPAVGVVVVGKGGAILARAHRSERDYDYDCHAEYVALIRKLRGKRIPGATLYTTLEPCTDVRRPGKIDCAERVVKSGVSEVVVGMLDPDVRVCAKGWLYLESKGVRVRRFPAQLEREIRELNLTFIEAVSNERRPKLVRRRSKRRAPVLNFIGHLEPDPVAVLHVAEVFKQRPTTPEIHWPAVNDALWQCALQERTRIIEHLRLGVPGGDSPRKAKNAFEFVDRAIDFGWRIRTGASARIPKMWQGMAGISRLSDRMHLFARALTGFLTVCNFQILHRLYYCQRRGEGDLFPRGHIWADWAHALKWTEIYRDAFGYEEPFCVAIVPSIGFQMRSGRHGKMFYKITVPGEGVEVHAPQSWIIGAGKKSLDHWSPLYSEFVIPQKEFALIGRHTIVQYGPIKIERVLNALREEVDVEGEVFLDENPRFREWLEAKKD